MTPATTARMMAGIPATNMSLYRQIRFLVGDPAVWIETPADGGVTRTLILRDIEIGRARKHARVDRVCCPKDFAPAAGLSGDRETATAQSAAELLVQHGIGRVVADRSLPLVYADHLRQRGLDVQYDPDLGVADRRHKDADEVAHLREAQRITEGAMRMACEMVGRATVADDGILVAGGAPLTSESIRAAIDIWLLERGYTNPGSIVANGPAGADCHNLGSGPIRSGQPVIIDIFPRNSKTLYNGDCTRTVVHGPVPPAIAKMHAAVVAAKAAGTAATRAGATGEHVHRATIDVIRQHGFDVGLPSDQAPDSYCAMVHGTGHGIGLDVHEPPLLDFGGPALVAGDALTIEPGVYSKAIGGVRVEDLVVVTDDGCVNLNELPEGLRWE